MSNFIPDDVTIQNLKTQAEDRLRAAKSLFDMKFYNDAINRAYYAVFSALTLLFYKSGKSFSSHKALISAFHKDFIHTKIMSKNIGEITTDLLNKRHACDYEASARFSDEDASTAVNQAEALMHRVFEYLKV